MVRIDIPPSTPAPSYLLVTYGLSKRLNLSQRTCIVLVETPVEGNGVEVNPSVKPYDWSRLQHENE